MMAKDEVAPVGEDPRQLTDLVVLPHLEFPHSAAAQKKMRLDSPYS
jgi:hypothetical protein